MGGRKQKQQLQRLGYGQFCPVAVAAEVFAERWTPLLVRELLCGSERFNDLQRGLPRMSSSLLSRRLKELEHAGVIERRPLPVGHGASYHLTQSGRELAPLVEGMGVWAQRWMRHDLVADENLDPDLLMWDMRRNLLDKGFAVDARFVVQIELAGMPSKRRFYWLVFERGDIDVCIKDPGHDVDLAVCCPLRVLTETWLGHRPMAAAIRAGEVTVDGTRKDIKCFTDWFAISMFAAAGREPQGND